MNPLLFVKAVLRESGAWTLSMALVLGLALSLGIAVSLSERALRQGSAEAGDAFDLLIGAKGSSIQLMLGTVYLQPQALSLIPGSTVSELLAQEGVAWAAPVVFGDRWQDSPVIGTTASLVTLGGRRGLASGRLFAERHEAVIGAGVALRAGDTFTPAHGLIRGAGHTHAELKYRVTGQLPATGTPWDRAILVPVESVWAAHGVAPHVEEGHKEGHEAAPPETGHHPLTPDLFQQGTALPGISAVVVKPVSVAAAYTLRAYWQTATRELSPGKSVGMQGVFTGEVLTELFAALGNVREVMQWMAWAAQAVALCSVMLAGALLVSTRRDSLSLLRMLGASRGYLMSGVWCLVGVSIVLGIVVGLVLGWGMAEAIAYGVYRQTGIALSVTPAKTEGLFIVISLGLGSLCALVPASMAYRRLR